MGNSKASALLSLLGMWASAAYYTAVQAGTGMWGSATRVTPRNGLVGKVWQRPRQAEVFSSGVLLLWPYVLTKSVSSRLHPADSSSLSLPAGQEGERPHVVKRSTQNCDSTYDSYCLNNGQCMLLVDIHEHHCKCERGFYGPRCSNAELVVQPMGEEQIIVTILCVCLLIIGLAGTLYFCCKWCKKNRFPRQQKRQGYKGVQTA